MIQPLSVALVVAGGTSSFLEDIYISARMELLVPSTGTGPARSCSLPSLPSGRSEPSVDIVGGELVVCGGEGGEQSCLRLAETGSTSYQGGGKVYSTQVGWRWVLDWTHPEQGMSLGFPMMTFFCSVEEYIAMKLRYLVTKLNVHAFI